MAGLPNMNPLNTLINFCSSGDSITSFVVDGTANDPNLAIINGAATLLAVSMKDFFIPLSKWQYFTYHLSAGATQSIEECSVGGVAVDGEVQFIGIVVEYPDTDVDLVTIDSSEKYIRYEFPTGSAQQSIGKILLLSGSTKPGFGLDLGASPGGLKLINPHTLFDVIVKVIIFS